MQRQTSLLRSLDIQRRVIGALIMREVLTRYGRHNIGFLWLFAEPMIFTLGIIALWSFVKVNHGGNISLVAFAVTGYSSVLMWRGMPSRTMSSIAPNLALMYHRNVKIFDVLMSRVLVEFLGASISFIVLATMFTLAGWMKPPVDLFKVCGAWLMLAWFGVSLGVLLGALSERSDIFEKIWPPMTYILFPLSGAGFMVDWLPNGAREAVLVLPMVHGIEYLREGYFGDLVHAHYSLTYMSAVCLGLTALGLAQERFVSWRVTPE